MTETLDLSPARWIWFPSQRTLANTFVLFRREIFLPARPLRAAGWITADSRYKLTINGERIQWGPAPSDPRWLDTDPVDLTEQFAAGNNVIGAEVLFYGSGDGTWVAGKPGFICRIDIECEDGSNLQIVSDQSWQVFLDRAHKPGQHRRWFLRALQEQFDARLHPYGWNTLQYQPDHRWLPAMEMQGAADKPPLCTNYYEYSYCTEISDPDSTSLRPRLIPKLQEFDVPVLQLRHSAHVSWSRDPEDWFDFRTPDSFTVGKEPAANQIGESWSINGSTDGNQSAILTFELSEQVVGWPYFTIEAPEGTVVELICQESHDPGKTDWLDSQYYSWTRFICKEGVNHFETFDFESLLWIQLHVHHASRPVTFSHVGVRRRMYDWPNEPVIRCSDPELQKLFDASINTLHNSSQETCVDGMARERQQYSGDGGHQLHAIRYAFGDTALPRRFITTFSQGLSVEGYFMDSWPAFDRMSRVMMRSIGLSHWGPLLDHGVGFVFDCWHHYMFSGELEHIAEAYPRLLTFGQYLGALRGKDGLLPVENLGTPGVWIDHEAYRKQRHKQCAFNLYAAAMYKNALAPLAGAFGEQNYAEYFRKLGEDLHEAVVQKYWSAEHGMFINNLPWLNEEGEDLLCDRSLATAVLFDMCPGNQVEGAIKALAERPPHMGISYPCNAGWRYWALAKGGRTDVILKEFREIWATMASVVFNNTLQEHWTAKADSTEQWSHCALAPVFMLYMDILGIKPLSPGFRRMEIRPQLSDIGDFDVTAYTPRGSVRFAAELDRISGKYHVRLVLPSDCEAVLAIARSTLCESDPEWPAASEESGHTIHIPLKCGRENRFSLKMN